MAVVPTSTTCSVSPTRSTPNAACTSSLRALRSSLQGLPGYHWYVVPRVGYPDPDTFHCRLRRARRASTTSCGSAPASDAERTVLGGFSMGSVMSYALGLAGERPAPAGILAF